MAIIFSIFIGYNIYTWKIVNRHLMFFLNIEALASGESSVIAQSMDLVV